MLISRFLEERRKEHTALRDDVRALVIGAVCGVLLCGVLFVCGL